ncbi:hypothetical protein Tco_1116295 [Tanacetum coccineum]
MHTTMVPVQVKTMKIQAGVQVSRPGELRRHLQLWKRFGRLSFPDIWYLRIPGVAIIEVACLLGCLFGFPKSKLSIPSSYFLSKRKFVIVCYEKVVRIPLEGDEIFRVHRERTLGAAKALMNAKVDEPWISVITVVQDFTDMFPEDLSMITTTTN